MDNLRLSSGVKKIEVNDAGECIFVNLSDNTFFERFNNFIDWFDKKQVDVEKKSMELEKKYSDKEIGDEETANKFIFEKFADSTTLYKEICDDVSKQLDSLFGEGCLQKVFPDVQSPGFELIIAFLDAITPLLQKYAQERNEKINLQYNRKRKGART